MAREAGFGAYELDPAAPRGSQVLAVPRVFGILEVI